MIYLYNYLTPKYFYLSLILVYIILLLIIFFKKGIYQKLPLDIYKKNPELLLGYLDKYYIKNKYVTFSLFLFYILLKIGFILYLRYLYLNYEFFITKILSEIPTLSYLYILKMLGILLLFIVSIQLFYILLYTIFFDEMLKIYIYCMKNDKLLKLKNKIAAFYTKDITGPCYLFFECIYRKTPEPSDFFYNEYYSHDYIYKNKHVKKMTLIMINLTNKYHVAFLFIKFCRKICHMLYVHFDHENVFKYLPWFLLIITFLYDFFNLCIYYTYYLLFFCYLSNLYNNFYKFVYRFDIMLISELKEYFYENNPEYCKQRVFDNKNLTPFIKNARYKSLLYTLNNPEIIEHIYYNFKKESDEDIKMRIMNLRFYTIIILSILILYLLYLILNNKIICNNYSIILVGIIMWIITIFYGKYTYALEQEDPNDNKFPMYIYNKKYEIIFWVLIVLQCYVFWKILFKPEITFMGTEVLLELPFDLLKINKNYNMEEKILYLFQYFEYKLNTIEPENHEYLRHILRKIDFNSIINLENQLNIKDIEVYINLLLDNHELLKVFVNKSIFHFDYLIQEIFEDLRNFINTTKFKAEQIPDSYLWEFIENNKNMIKNLLEEKNNIFFTKRFIKQKFFDDLCDFMQERKSRNNNIMVLLGYMLFIYANKVIFTPIDNFTINIGQIISVFFQHKVYLKDYEIELKLRMVLWKFIAFIFNFYWVSSNIGDNFIYMDGALVKELLEYGYYNAHKVFYQPDFTIKSSIVDKDLLSNIKKFFIK